MPSHSGTILLYTLDTLAENGWLGTLLEEGEEFILVSWLLQGKLEAAVEELDCFGRDGICLR